jgi:L-lactate dehydrogenase complex protein LldG
MAFVAGVRDRLEIGKVIIQMATREQMMARIRTALGRSPEDTPGSPLINPSELPELGQVMARIEAGELIAAFMAEFERVSTKVWRAKSLTDLDAILSGLVQEKSAGSAVVTRNPLLAKLSLVERLQSLGVAVQSWPDKAERVVRQAYRELCFTAAIGFTGVDFALAETGSLVTSSMTEGAQLSSLAPPVHVAILRESQVVASLEEVLAGIAVWRDPQSPSAGRSVVFITGTSRTADIEQIVIRGVHGPQEVHAILIEDACLA